jgi:hypothetical protein
MSCSSTHHGCFTELDWEDPSKGLGEKQKEGPLGWDSTWGKEGTSISAGILRSLL